MAEDRMLSDEILLGLINKNSGGGGGTNNYNDLSNQPQINNNTLIGNKSASDLGLVAAEADKGLSTNDYTDADKAIVGGVEAALAGKQDTLTARDYISIDAQNNISVNRELVPHQTSYRIKGIGQYAMNITKYIDGVQESSTDYSYSQGTTRTIDDAFTINDTYSGSDGYIWQFVWLKDSTTHDKDYTVSYRAYNAAFDFTEVFNDEDLSGYKLVIKSEMDSVLDDKQDKTDNNLTTTSKEITGAINEVKSGLTNVDVALSVPNGTGKNLIPMTVGSIKALNTSGTWSGNTYTVNGVTFTVQTDNDGRITGININGTASARTDFYLFNNVNVNQFSGMILNGCPDNGGISTYFLTIAQTSSPWTDYTDIGDGVNIGQFSVSNGAIYITVKQGTTVSNLTFYPMIRPTTITDPTFTPYIPSVESRIEAVESGLTNLANLKFLSVNFTDTFEANATLTNGVTISDLTGGVLTNDSRIKGIVLYNVYPFYMFQLQYQGKIMLGTDVARSSQETITNRMVIMYI